MPSTTNTSEMRSVRYRINSLMDEAAKRPSIIVFAEAVLFTVLFSYLSIVRFHEFMQSYDLGEVVQALYNTAFRGKLLVESFSPNIYYQGYDEVSYLAVHFSPILLLLVPLYRLIPNVEVLLVLKAFLTCFSVLPAYLLTKDVVGERRAIPLITVFLLHPGLQAAGLVNLEPAMFIPMLFFLTIYSIRKGREKLFYVLFFFTLTTHEFVGLLLAAFFAVDYVLGGKRRRIEAFAAGFAVLWVLLAFQMMSMLKPLELPIQREFFKFNLIGGLSYDFFGKIVLILMILAPYIFIPLSSPYILSLLPFFAWIASINKPATDLFGWHYAYYYLPFIFMALVDSAKESRLKKKHLALMCLLSLVLTPLNPLTIGSMPGLAYTPQPFNDDHVDAINRVLSSIPSGSTIVAQNPTSTLLAGRSNVYVLMPRNTTVDYIVADLKHSDVQTYQFDDLLDEAFNSGEYGTQAELDGVVLLKRGYIGDPTLFEPLELMFSYSDMIDGVSGDGKLALGDSSTIYDPNSASKFAMLAEGSSHAVDVAWFGPFKPLMPGSYEITYRLKVSGKLERTSPIFKLDAVSDKGKVNLASSTIYGMDIPKVNGWFELTLSFSLNRYVKDIEFRGLNVNGIDLYLDYIDVRQVDAKPGRVERTIPATDFIVREGELNDSMLIHMPQDNAGVFWYGPFIHLDRGNYTVKFWVWLDKTSKDTAEPMLILDVCRNKGEEIVAAIKVNASDVEPKTWVLIPLSFSLKMPSADVELRCRYITQGVEAYFLKADVIGVIC